MEAEVLMFLVEALVMANGYAAGVLDLLHIELVGVTLEECEIAAKILTFQTYDITAPDGSLFYYDITATCKMVAR